MGGEIITLHLGQAGVQLSHALWELVCVEHGITAAGGRAREPVNLDEQEVGREFVFREVREGKFVPRALLVDLEPSVIDEVRTGAYRGLWNPQNLINGKEDAASNFARGYYSQARFEMADLMERVRVLVEQCDNMACFKLLYSANGGTGSGLTSALCERLSDDYGKKYKFATTVYPSPGYSELMVEPYNALLHSSTNLTFCDCVVITDNEATLNVAEESLRLRHDGFTVPNRVIANAITTQFLSHRYKFIGQQPMQIDDLLINLIPYPRIHFPMMAFAPFFGPACGEFERVTALDLVRGVFEDTNQLLSVSAVRRAYISCALLFRGAISPIEAVNAVAFIKGDRMSRARFVDWCPTGFKLGVNFAYPTQAPTFNTVTVRSSSLSMIAGNLAIRDVWTGIGRRFDQLYERRAFVHWYVAEGMEEGEFSLAREVIQQLVEDYEAIAKDAEGALFDESSNQSQNQVTKSSVRVNSLLKRSPANGTDVNVNQATTLDDQNSLRTLENNDENLSLDTNQHYGGSRGTRIRTSHPRSYAESTSFRDEEGSKISARRGDPTSRIHSTNRRRLRAHNGPPQAIALDKLAEGQQQQSSNALIEPIPYHPFYGTNCSAAVNHQELKKPSKSKTSHRHHRRKRSQSSKHVDDGNYVYPVIPAVKEETETSNGTGNSSGIPVFSDKVFEMDVYRRAKQLSELEYRDALYHNDAKQCNQSPVPKQIIGRQPLKTDDTDTIIKAKEYPVQTSNGFLYKPSIKATVTESDSESSTIHVYPITNKQPNHHSRRTNFSNDLPTVTKMHAAELDDRLHKTYVGEAVSEISNSTHNSLPMGTTCESTQYQDRSIVSVTYEEEGDNMISTGSGINHSSGSQHLPHYRQLVYSDYPEENYSAIRRLDYRQGEWQSNELVDTTYMSGSLRTISQESTVSANNTEKTAVRNPYRRTEQRQDTHTISSPAHTTLVSGTPQNPSCATSVERSKSNPNRPSHIPVGVQYIHDRTGLNYGTQTRPPMGNIEHIYEKIPTFISTTTAMLGKSTQENTVVRKEAVGNSGQANYLSTTVIKVRNFAQVLPSSTKLQTTQHS